MFLASVKRPTLGRDDIFKQKSISYPPPPPVPLLYIIPSPQPGPLVCKTDILNLSNIYAYTLRSADLFYLRTELFCTIRLSLAGIVNFTWTGAYSSFLKGQIEEL